MGGDATPMRPGVGEVGPSRGGSELVLNAEVQLISYAAAVGGRDEYPRSDDINQSSLSGNSLSGLVESRRPEGDENRQFNAADVIGQSSKDVRSTGLNDLNNHGSNDPSTQTTPCTQPVGMARASYSTPLL